MNILFVAHEGYSTAIFRSQVIEHCKSVNVTAHQMRVLTYEPFKKSWKLSVKNASRNHPSMDVSVVLKKCMNIYFPFSYIWNLILLFIDLYKYTRTYNIDIVHARTEYTASMCILLSYFFRFKVVWDCRGDSIDELLFAALKLKFIFRQLFKLYVVTRQHLIIRTCHQFSHGAVFVSEQLAKLHWRTKTKNTHIIPCPVPEDTFRFCPIARQCIRDELSVQDNIPLFIYSGSMVRYQGLDLLKSTMITLLKNLDARFLILTNDIEIAKVEFARLPQSKLIFMNCVYEDVYKYYSASDIGLILREKRSLNWVASPTKFGEYCLTGLRVLHNETIEQVSSVCTKLKNDYIHTQNSGNGISDDDRCKISEASKMIFGRNRALEHYLSLYDKIKQID